MFAKLNMHLEGDKKSDVGFCFMLWSIWLGRNQCIFKKQNLDSIRVTSQLVAEYLDADVKVSGGSLATHDNTKWQSPLDLWIKMNSDSTMYKGQSRGGLGVIAHNDEGFLVDACGSFETMLFVEHLELLAIVRIISMAREYGWGKWFLRLILNWLLVV